MTVILKNVSYTFQQRQNQVISNLSMTVQQGEFVSIVGKSGTGKSTIFKMLTGLLTPDEGKIEINNEKVVTGAVGYMPQKDLLLPWCTILENVMLASEIQRNLKLTKEEASMWLQRVGLADYVHAYPKQLSGGMKQRAAFLRALLTGKDVLLLDEPFGALDALTKREMQAWLLSIWQDLNKTVIFITHDLEEAIYLSDRIIILQQDKTTEEVAIPLPRPRQPDILYSPELQQLRRELERKLANAKY